MTFNFSTAALCSLMEKFSFLPSMGFNWYPGMESSLALSEQPSAPRTEIAPFACKMSNCLDPSLKRLVAFAIITHFGMSLFHDAHVVMRSFPDWINRI